MSDIDWLQSPVTIFCLAILFDNPLKLNQNNTMTIEAGLVTSLYSHDIVLILF